MTSAFHRPALDLLADLRRGKVAAELTDEIHELIAACRDTGKKGSISLTLTFEPDKDADMDREPRFRIGDQITTKKPRRTVKPSLLFVTDEGNLVRTDPRQETFEGLRGVDAADDDQAASAAGKQAAR